MIWIDYTIIGLGVISSTVGLFKGYSQLAFSLLSAFVALWVGIGFSRELAYWLPASIKDPALKLATAFIALYLLTVLLGEIIRLLMGRMLKPSPSNWLDRLGGLLLGLLRGGIWVTAMVILAGLSVLPQAPWWHQAKLLPPFQTTAVWLQDHIPSALLENIHYR